MFYLATLLKNIAVTWLNYRHARYPEQFTASSTQVNIATFVEDGFALWKDGVVFELGFSVDGEVVRKEDSLCLSVSDVSEYWLVADAGLAALHNEGELGVDTFLLLTCHSIYKLNS